MPTSYPGLISVTDDERRLLISRGLTQLFFNWLRRF
ncbi:MAG: hypothetical protein ACFWT9_11880 [Lactiplantibacillus plantarum]